MNQNHPRLLLSSQTVNVETLKRFLQKVRVKSNLALFYFCLLLFTFIFFFKAIADASLDVHLYSVHTNLQRVERRIQSFRHLPAPIFIRARTLIIIDYHIEGFGRKLRQAAFHAFEPSLKEPFLFFMIFAVSGVFDGRAVIGHLIERPRIPFGVAPVFLQDIERHAVKIQIRIARSHLGSLIESARDPVYGFVSILFGQKASSALEERDEFAANIFVPFRRAFRVSAKLGQQSREGFFS